MPIVIGCILLVAAGLKIYERLTDPTSGDVSAGRGWLLLLLAECEIALAAWLLSGRGRRLARRIAIAMFVLFASYNLYLVAIGQESCNCLGAVKVHPVYMFLFDVAALSALSLWWRPGRTVDHPATASLVGRRATVACVGVLVIGGGTLATALAVRVLWLGEGVTVDGAPTYDFGEVLANQRLSHTFRLKNSSQRAVEVVRIKSSCGCTTTDDLAGQLISPGEVKEVPVSLRTGIVDGETPYGDITVYYRPVGSSEAETAYRVLRIMATVRTDFEVTPTIIDFGSIAVGQTAVRTVSLQPLWMADARVTAAEITGESFRVEPLSGDGREVRITYSPRPALRSGPDERQLAIRTNSPNVPLVRLPVLARRVVPAEVMPMAVVIDSETRGVLSREIIVTADKEFDISRVEADDLRVTARQKNPGRSRSQILVVTVPDAPDAPVNANLVLTLSWGADTASEEAYCVSVPVHRLQYRDKGRKP